jgi:type I restriction enzyme, S subunit
VNAHWPTKRLDEVFEIARGGSPRPIEDFLTNDPKGLNWIKIGDATASGKFIKATKEKIRSEGLAKSRFVSSGDFLLTNSMSFGRPYIMATDGCIHDGWLVLKPRDRKLVDQDFFYHLLGSNVIYERLAARASGSTVKNLNTEIVSSIEVKVPPIDEQRRIAAILDKADGLRGKRKRALDLLESLTQSIFLEMFGDLVECCEYPRGTISDWVANFDTGKNLAPDPDARQINGYRVLKVSAVTTGVFLPDKSKPLPVGYEPPASHVVRKGDLLFSRANTADLIGATAYVESAYEKLVLPDKIWRFVWRRSNVPNPRFIHALFSTLSFRRELSKLATGTSGSMKNISKPKVLGIEVALPNRRQQDEFAVRYSAIQKSMSATVMQATMLEDQFYSLQSRAFLGQL